MNAYMDKVDEIRSTRDPEAGVYLDRLTDDQRMSLLRDQKTEKATEARENASKAYRKQVEAYHAAIRQRASHIQERLFKVEDAGALSRAATSTDTELGAMLELAAQAQNDELGRAVFVAAEQRGLGDLMAAYFDRINPEGRDLYREWVDVPPQEVLERQLRIDAILPPPNPDGLMSRLTTPSY